MRADPRVYGAKVCQLRWCTFTATTTAIHLVQQPFHTRAIKICLLYTHVSHYGLEAGSAKRMIVMGFV
jgi:hypothetical protein